MRAYLQHSGYHQKRSGSSHFYEESGPRSERTIHASNVGLRSTILGDFMNLMPLILYALSITEVGTRFSFPKAGTPLSDVVPADTTHISLFDFIWGFFFL